MHRVLAVNPEYSTIKNHIHQSSLPGQYSLLSSGSFNNSISKYPYSTNIHVNDNIDSMAILKQKLKNIKEATAKIIKSPYEKDLVKQKTKSSKLNILPKLDFLNPNDVFPGFNYGNFYLPSQRISDDKSIAIKRSLSIIDLPTNKEFALNSRLASRKSLPTRKGTRFQNKIHINPTNRLLISQSDFRVNCESLESSPKNELAQRLSEKFASVYSTDKISTKGRKSFSYNTSTSQLDNKQEILESVKKQTNQNQKQKEDPLKPKRLLFSRGLQSTQSQIFSGSTNNINSSSNYHSISIPNKSIMQNESTLEIFSKNTSFAILMQKENEIEKSGPNIKKEKLIKHNNNKKNSLEDLDYLEEVMQKLTYTPFVKYKNPLWDPPTFKHISMEGLTKKRGHKVTEENVKWFNIRRKLIFSLNYFKRLKISIKRVISLNFYYLLQK